MKSVSSKSFTQDNIFLGFDFSIILPHPVVLWNCEGFHNEIIRDHSGLPNPLLNKLNIKETPKH